MKIGSKGDRQNSTQDDGKGAGGGQSSRGGRGGQSGRGGRGGGRGKSLLFFPIGHLRRNSPIGKT